jgi:hypothetical protein
LDCSGKESELLETKFLPAPGKYTKKIKLEMKIKDFDRY